MVSWKMEPDREPNLGTTTLSVFDHRLRLDTYLKFRKEKKMRNSWRFYGYGSTTRARYYKSKMFDFTLLLEKDPMGFTLYAGLPSGKFLSSSLGYLTTEAEATKILKIVQDFTTTYGWSWEKITSEYNKVNHMVDNKSVSAARPDKVSYKEHMTDSEIREMYNEVYAQVNQKYHLAKPPLRIIHKMSSNYGAYTISKNIVYVHDSLTEDGMRDTMIHELSHALVHQRHLESTTRSHGYYFLQFYKVLSGRDYIEDQDQVIAEEKAEMREKYLDGADYRGKITYK